MGIHSEARGKTQNSPTTLQSAPPPLGAVMQLIGMARDVLRTQEKRAGCVASE